MRRIVFLLVFLPSSSPAQVTITGSSRQLTTSPFDQVGPSISGNIVAYTDYSLGSTQGEVYYYDLTTSLAHQLTTASPVTSQLASDVSGNTIVYTETEVGGTQSVKKIAIGGAPVTLGSGDSFSPGIDGPVVAWVDVSGGTAQILALDTAGGGAPTQLTDNPPNINSLSPNVSGRNIVYSTGLDPDNLRCQVFVQDFDTRKVTQVTDSATGCNSSPDISGNTVVYQANRDGTQNIYVFDIATATETRVVLPGLQQNPHVSGPFVAFEDVAQAGGGNLSSIRLYHIPSGTVLTAVQASTQLESAFLNDIDGTRVVYTSAAAGNYDIYLYSFTLNGVKAQDCADLNGATPFYSGSFTKQPGESDDFRATFDATAGPGLACVTKTDTCEWGASVRVDGVVVRDERHSRTTGEAFLRLRSHRNTVKVDTEFGECAIGVSVYPAEARHRSMHRDLGGDEAVW